MVKYPDGRVERLSPDVVVIHSSLGPDFVRVCPAHRWASPPTVYRTDLPRCPSCEIYGDVETGVRLFNKLQQRFMPAEAQP